jgi:hypothetical protein
MDALLARRNRPFDIVFRNLEGEKKDIQGERQGESLPELEVKTKSCEYIGQNFIDVGSCMVVGNKTKQINLSVDTKVIRSSRHHQSSYESGCECRHDRLKVQE